MGVLTVELLPRVCRHIPLDGAKIKRKDGWWEAWEERLPHWALPEFSWVRRSPPSPFATTPAGAHCVYWQQTHPRFFFHFPFPLLVCETPQIHPDFNQCICSSPCTRPDKWVFNGENPSWLFFPLQPVFTEQRNSSAESSSISCIINQILNQIQA